MHLLYFGASERGDSIFGTKAARDQVVTNMVLNHQVPKDLAEAVRFPPNRPAHHHRAVLGSCDRDP